MNVPPEAITAGAQAITDVHDRRLNADDYSVQEYRELLARAVIEAAAPFIEAAERDRIRQLI